MLPNATQSFSSVTYEWENLATCHEPVQPKLSVTPIFLFCVATTTVSVVSTFFPLSPTFNLPTFVSALFGQSELYFLLLNLSSLINCISFVKTLNIFLCSILKCTLQDLEVTLRCERVEFSIYSVTIYRMILFY